MKRNTPALSLAIVTLALVSVSLAACNKPGDGGAPAAGASSAMDTAPATMPSASAPGMGASSASAP